MSEAYTVHNCDNEGLYRCEGEDCGENGAISVCDRPGCDNNPFRVGNQDFFGPSSSHEVDTSHPFTVVTQFLTDGNSDKGDLVEIKRFFVQNGKTIENPSSKYDPELHNSLSDDYCANQNLAFKESNIFASKGGMSATGEALDRGLVFVLSLWDDYAAHMLWLDSDYPTDQDPSSPGVARGDCATSSGGWDG